VVVVPAPFILFMAGEIASRYIWGNLNQVTG